MLLRRKLLLALLLLTLLPAFPQERVTLMDSAIPSPSLLSVCEKRQALVVAGANRIEIFKNLAGKFTKESLSVEDPIVRIKCLKQGFIAVATQDKFYIIDPAGAGSQKIKGFKGRPLSIAEEPENNMTYLLLSDNSLELSELQAVNYGASFSRASLPLALQRNIGIASYVGNRQYIYVSDELNQLSLFRFPFTASPAATIQVEDVRQVREVKGGIGSALLTDFNGNFVLIKEEEEVGSWVDTTYQRGCLCTKEKFVLANSKKLAMYDFQEVKFYDGFTVTDLADIACEGDGETNSIYLLDGSGKVVVVSVEGSEGGYVIYLIVVLLFVAVIMVAKFAWSPAKHALSTDLDDASRQDRENNYRELREWNVKDKVKETQ